VPSDALLDQCIDVRQVFAIGEGGETVRANNAVEFFLGFLLDFWIEYHGEEKAVVCRDGLYKVKPTALENEI